MLFRKLWLALNCLLFACIASPVFANLPYYPIQLPRDDAAHLSNTPYPVQNMSEWWYYSGKLVTEEGRHFGYYVIIFDITKHVFGKEVSMPIYVMQLTDIDKNKVYGNMIYYPNNQTEFSNKELAITLGKNKEVKLNKNAGIYTLNAVTQTNQGPVVKLSLLMKPARNMILMGDKGLMPMSKDTNSYYYSFTRLATTGMLQIGNEKFQINPKASSSWMDHQWGDFMLSSDNAWFWTSIRLNNNIDINLTNVIDNTTKIPGKIKVATILMPNGKVLHTSDFDVKQINQDPHAYPLTYDIAIKSIKLQLHITSLANNQDSNQRWEGISNIEGTYQGKPVHGFAFVENTARYGWPVALMIDQITSSIGQIWHVLRAF